MRAKVMTIGITAAAIIALALQASPQAIAQGNANKPAAAKKAKPAATKSANTAAPAQAAAPAQKPAAAKKPARKKKPAMAGVPSGVGNCIKHLSDMAAKDPLIAYEGKPEQIVNNGLLWNDPKSKCYASDENMRKKVADLAMKWRMHDAAAVRSILQELAGMAPQ
jgi:hypothetical protein